VVKKHRLLLPVVAFALALAGANPPPPAGKTPTKPPATSTQKSAAPAKKGSATSSSTTARKGSRKRGAPVARAAPGQAAPTPDRVRDIQQALNERGYSTPVDGAWSKDTEAALAKFQADQNLDGKGKLNSLSLIGLGLGPKHDSNQELPPPQAPQKD